MHASQDTSQCLQTFQQELYTYLTYPLELCNASLAKIRKPRRNTQLKRKAEEFVLDQACALSLTIWDKRMCIFSFRPFEIYRSLNRPSTAHLYTQDMYFKNCQRAQV
eukprot:1565367-Amphidinium_carterae.1